MQGDPKPEELNEWYDAVAQYGGGSLYADQVYETLKKGASTRTSTGIGHNEAPDPYNSGQYGRAGHHTDPGYYSGTGAST